MDSSRAIAVLGLGRMGSAMAGRLATQGWQVTGWTRTGSTRTGSTRTGSTRTGSTRPGQAAEAVKTTGAPDEAVANADIVLLALFDGPACVQVLDRVQRSLRPEAIVVNTSTIAPAEAQALASRLGTAYVQAPVLGSVPAVTGGALTILAGAEEPTLIRARPVLDTLGEVRHVGDAATAAALKLIANSSLAGAVLALRDSLSQGDALGLPREQVLDVLELGQLGSLVSRKRSFLAGDPPQAQFTLGALAKDLALLADASQSPLRSAAELEDLQDTMAQADFALAATIPAPGDAVLAPLRAYIRGHATGDPVHFRDAFLPTARIEGLRDGSFVSWDLTAFRALFSGKPAPDEPARSRRIDTVDVHGSVATASMTLRHGDDTFTDIFLLVHADGQWRIASKAYHRHQLDS